MSIFMWSKTLIMLLLYTLGFTQPRQESVKKLIVKPKKNLDIEALTEEQKTRKVVINTNTEHFWSSGMSCRDDDDKVIEIVDPSTTTFEVEGR